MSGDSLGYVAALDIGTTTIRCLIINSLAETVGSAFENVKLIYPHPGYVEINPDDLWDSIVKVVKKAIEDANISVREIKSLGISTQRSTFITWKKSDGSYFHNFITWKDLRTQALVKEVNSYWSIIALRWLAYIGYIFTRNIKMLFGSRLKFASNHVTVRLLWVLQNIPAIKKALQTQNVMFGTVDTWLLYKLTAGKIFATDITNASATGFYDTFDLKWSLITNLLNIPDEILPEVVSNDYDFGHVDPSIFGSAIKIGCIMSDQSSSMFGSGCFYENDLKVTLGTGGFLDINTCDSVQPSAKGMYPLVGWKLRDKVTYMAEVPSNDAGSLIQWALNAQLITSPSESAQIAGTVDNTDGVYFIAAFSGLGPPINNEKAASGFIGIKPTTKKAHMVRAILESIVFRIALCFQVLKEERPRHYKYLSIDGGVSRNDFICQMLADVTDLNVERLASSEMSALGVAFLAGISCGFWKDEDDIHKLRNINRTFKPASDEAYREKCQNKLREWVRAANKFKSWYQ